MTTVTRKPKPSDRRLLAFKEPRLRFGSGQILEDPKDGLLLFGPPEKPMDIHYGVIGTPSSIQRFEVWAKNLSKPIAADPKVGSSILFPGFETVFRMPWHAQPRVRIVVDEEALARTIHNTDPYQRVFNTVDLFAKPISNWTTDEDIKVALWFVVVPEVLWKLCRPESTVAKADGVAPAVKLSHSRAMAVLGAPDLFGEVNEAAEKHLYENHFHNQLKARLLECEAITQIVRETTIAPDDFLNRFGKRTRKLQDDATVAWNLSTAIYYKAGAKPWTLADIRGDVCYIGLVFKRTNNPDEKFEACCGAQMFLHTGEGIVFKGAVGSWASDKPGEFHLPRDKAAEIVRRCVETYKDKQGKPPTELFIHGRTNFDDNEIAGFKEAAPPGTTVTGIQIQRPNDLKLFPDGRKAILRGLALKLGKRSAFLWTSGYVPKLLTYPGREVPTPLKVRIVFGDADLEVVLRDIVALTKLNFNTCIFGDGFPVTLRFADDVGEILTAIPEVNTRHLPFRHYI